MHGVGVHISVSVYASVYPERITFDVAPGLRVIVSEVVVVSPSSGAYKAPPIQNLAFTPTTMANKNTMHEKISADTSAIGLLPTARQ